MDKLKVYMDNCCYGRPFDDLTQEKIRDEATAKMYIQSLIKSNSLDLYTSFMLFHEINDMPSAANKEHIMNFVNEYSSLHIGGDNEKEVVSLSEEIMRTGIKKKDAVHVACGIIMGCDYFITTDKRLINYKTDRIQIINPIKFVEIWRIKQYG